MNRFGDEEENRREEQLFWLESRFGERVREEEREE